MGPLRILQVHCRYTNHGGEDRVVEDQAVMLKEAGHEVELFSVSNERGLVSTLAALSVSPWNPLQAGRIREFVREWRPDVAQVHNHWFSLSPSVIRALDDERIPTVLTIHNYRSVCASADLWRGGNICHECVGARLPTPGIRHRCYRGSSALSLAAASASAMQKRSIRTLPRGQVVVPSQFVRHLLVTAGLDDELFQVLPWATLDPGRRIGEPSRSCDVCYVGRLEPEIKGIERLVSLWNRAKAAGNLRGLRLNLVGSGPLEGHESIAGDDVVCRGHLERVDLDRLLLSARALVCPSLWEEPFGLSAIEGLAAGLPVLATDRGALAETVGPLGSECLLNPESDRAWEEGLNRLSGDGWVDLLGRRARSLFESRFSVKTGLPRLEEVLYGAIERNAQRSVGPGD